MNETSHKFFFQNFVETDTYLTVKEVAYRAVLTKSATLVYGKAGLGKTFALQKLAIEKGARYFEVNPTNKGPSGMMESFITAFGGYPRGRNTRDLLMQCKLIAGVDRHAAEFGWAGKTPDQYRQSRLLLVDEYQNFEPSALRLLLGIGEEIGLPLLFCGNSESLVTRSREAKLASEQLHQRMLMRFEVGTPSERDCRNIGILYNVEGADAYAAITAFGTSTSLRHLVDLLRKAEFLTGGEGSIKRRTLESALISHGGEKSLPLLSSKAADLAAIGEETGSPKRIAKYA